MGGSYGGYLTAWTISQDHRFAAAIVERGYLDPASFVGSLGHRLVLLRRIHRNGS